MAEKDESAWVFDSLVGFLQGPIWSAPLLTFIEEKSLIFEPETLESKEYRQVYQEYKNLVDLLLGCYMEDMGISPELFERACTLNKSTRVPVQFQQSLFEQIWAANEYEVFKRMMTQKNLELELQALKMIEQKFGLTPTSTSNENTELVDNELPIEELMKTQPVDEENTDDANIAAEVVGDEEAMRLEHERLAAEYKIESTLLKEALKKSTDTSPIQEEPEDLDETEESKVSNEVELINPENKPEANELSEDTEHISSTSDDSRQRIDSQEPKEKTRDEDIRKRQQYLKAQRDKLLALKKQVRSQKLEANTSRPSSARVLAEATIDAIDGKHQPFPSHHQTIDPSILQVRKALAARLKAEVVQKLN